jgi:hypothetical protein
MRGCQVCINPRNSGLTTSQIEWHNIGHPGMDKVPVSPNGTNRLRSMVIIRPGDQILYEITPGSWSRIDEIDLAIAAGHPVDEVASNCRRCSRLVLQRRVRAGGIWTWLADKIALLAGFLSNRGLDRRGAPHL